MTSLRFKIILLFAELLAPHCAEAADSLRIQSIHHTRTGISYEHLTWDSIQGSGERKDVWRRDKDHSRELSAADDDYRDAKPLIKFHSAPSRDAGTQSAVDATFNYANCSPGDSALNGGLWNALEKHVYELVQPTTSVHVVTGGAFLPGPDGIVRYPVYGPHRVAKPTHYVKAVLKLANGQPSMFAVIVPNERPAAGKTWKDFLVSVDQAELALGEDCFDWLDDRIEAELESKK